MFWYTIHMLTSCPSHNRQRSPMLYLMVLAILVLACPTVKAKTTTTKETLPGGLPTLIENGGYICTKDGVEIKARAPEIAFVPASTIKVATSLAALKRLGPDYRFQTHFFIDSVGTLYIKGYGDPYLVSEEVSLILERLEAHGVNVINDIVIDDSAFQLPAETPSWSDNSLNPYDAANNALAVNFNTMGIKVTNKGQITSAEPQTPTLPIMQELGAALPTGNQRINISKSTIHINRYTAELFRALQKKKGLAGNGKIRIAKVPEKLPAIYIHYSEKPLDAVIKAMLAASSNFIANQLFLTIGAMRYGYPATWDKGQRAIKEFYSEELGLQENVLYMEEGSGLSRRNRITPRAMVTVLEAFKPHMGLLRSYGGTRLKTGTLTGTYAYAGYFSNGSSCDPFVILLNQQRNTRRQVLSVLQEIHTVSCADPLPVALSNDSQPVTPKAKTASRKTKSRARQ